MGKEIPFAKRFSFAVGIFKAWTSKWLEYKLCADNQSYENELDEKNDKETKVAAVDKENSVNYAKCVFKISIQMK